jgi:N-acetyltransferase
MSIAKSDYQRFFPDGFTLETPRILLRLIQPEDKETLFSLARDKALWTYFTKDLSDNTVFNSWMDKLFKEREQEIRMPLTIIDKHTHEICGSVNLTNISFYNQRLEIGSFWLGTGFLGTGLNTQTNFALLSYAFEAMKMERVEVRVDNGNERAKAACLKIGMKPEGVLRSHLLVHTGQRRDTLVLSIIRDEWQERKEHFFPELI